MSPALLTADVQPDQQLKILARAFEALLLTTQQLSSKEKLLQTRLEYAHYEYLKLAGRLPEGIDTHTKIISEKILSRYFEFEPLQKQTINPLDVVKDLASSGNVGDSNLAAITKGVECYKPFLAPQDDNQSSDASPCLVATRAGSLEKDFTTKGTRGSLRCPFAKPHNKPSENGVTNGIENALPVQNGVGDTCAIGNLDPIKAEQDDRRSSRAPTVRTSTTQCPISRCPIRFLDQHSPEEIADYVERHKHEIPRSHAICVKRYSKDSRQLDAKYGDLTNMIRGLSQKHQAYLPGHNHSVHTASSSAERVEKWAEDVGMKSDTETSIKGENGETENDDDRKSRFDRPLREVRVGESPSRPWGIHVPVPLPPAASSESVPHSQPAPVQTSGDKESGKNGPIDTDASLPNPSGAPRKAGRCPFGHGASVPPPDHPAIETETIRNEERPIQPTHDAEEKNEKRGDPPGVQFPPNGPTVVINGPMFFGFSAEHTATFMQQLANLGINKQ